MGFEGYGAKAPEVPRDPSGWLRDWRSQGVGSLCGSWPARCRGWFLQWFVIGKSFSPRLRLEIEGTPSLRGLLHLYLLALIFQTTTMVTFDTWNLGFVILRQSLGQGRLGPAKREQASEPWILRFHDHVYVGSPPPIKKRGWSSLSPALYSHLLGIVHQYQYVCCCCMHLSTCSFLPCKHALLLCLQLPARIPNPQWPLDKKDALCC